jgi:hypothetical protein
VIRPSLSTRNVLLFSLRYFTPDDKGRIALLALRFRHSPNGFRYRSNEPYYLIALFSTYALSVGR